jgi:hypothetical protein
VRYVATQSFVDPERIAYLAVCATAQYALRALAGGVPVRSFVSIAGWFHDAASVAPFYGGAAGVALRLERARQALVRYREHGEIAMVPAYAPGDDRAGMHFELDYYGNPKRGAVPSWKNEMAEMSWLHWLCYDGLSPAAAVTTPTLVVHADGCALPDNARLVYSRLARRKELAWLEGNQQDLRPTARRRRHRARRRLVRSTRADRRAREALRKSPRMTIVVTLPATWLVAVFSARPRPPLSRLPSSNACKDARAAGT